MSDGYDYCYLMKNGTKVLYLAPVSEVNRVLKNSLFTADRVDGKGTIAKDKRIYYHEITIQGDFVDSTEMQPDHKQAVQNLFARSSVTAEQQYRWLMGLALAVGGQFDLYLGNDAYKATSERDLDYDLDGCVLPQVVIDEVRESQDTRRSRIPYTLKLIAGFQSSSGEET